MGLAACPCVDFAERIGVCLESSFFFEFGDRCEHSFLLFLLSEFHSRTIFILKKGDFIFLRACECARLEGKYILPKSCCRVWSKLNHVSDVYFLDMCIGSGIPSDTSSLRCGHAEVTRKRITQFLLLFTWCASKEHINVLDKLIWFVNLHLA